MNLTPYTSESPDTIVHQLSRKFFIFRDPDTGAVLTEFDGSPVVPIRYPLNPRP